MTFIHQEVSEDENCRVGLTPADDGGALIEIEMSDDLAERIESEASALGVTPEDYVKLLMDAPFPFDIGE